MIHVKPDIEFIREIKKDCGSMLNACMQCGACTAVCELSQDHETFPRKEMIWAGWGLKDKLMSDPDIWLCHQCGDCTTTCPRDVKPGDVLAALRRQHFSYYARPRIIYNIINKPALLPVIIIIPAIITGLIIYLSGSLKMPEGEVNYSIFFPHLHLNISFTGFFILGLAGIIFSIRAFWKNINVFGQQINSKPNKFRRFIEVLYEALIHRKFNLCTAQKNRYLAHLLVFWGFIILLVVTFFAILSTIFFDYPLPFLSPVKIAGNLGGLAILSGCSIMILNRIINREKLKSTYTDWMFLLSLSLLVISGFIVELARFQNWICAYYIYFIHLVLVWMVILYLPYTRFAHFIYRITALVFIKGKV